MVTDRDVRLMLEGIPAGVTVYSGTVPARPSFPYVLLTVGVPRPLERSYSKSPHGYWQRVRTTVASLTEASVLIVSRHVQQALECSRVNGQLLAQDETDQPVYEDPDHVVDGVKVQYAILEWRINHPA